MLHQRICLSYEVILRVVESLWVRKAYIGNSEIESCCLCPRIRIRQSRVSFMLLAELAIHTALTSMHTSCLRLCSLPSTATHLVLGSSTAKALVRLPTILIVKVWVLPHIRILDLCSLASSPALLSTTEQRLLDGVVIAGAPRLLSSKLARILSVLRILDILGRVRKCVGLVHFWHLVALAHERIVVHILWVDGLRLHLHLLAAALALDEVFNALLQNLIHSLLQLLKLGPEVVREVWIGASTADSSELVLELRDAAIYSLYRIENVWIVANAEQALLRRFQHSNLSRKLLSILLARTAIGLLSTLIVSLDLDTELL